MGALWPLNPVFPTFLTTNLKCYQNDSQWLTVQLRSQKRKEGGDSFQGVIPCLTAQTIDL
jgi:hypothetical protein